MSTTPATPPTEQKPDSFHHKAAFYAMVALVGAFALNVASLGATTGSSPIARRTTSLIVGVVFLSAVPAGIIALLGIQKYGKKRLLGRGLAGVIIPILLTALALPAFLKVKEQKTQSLLKQAATEICTGTPKMVDEVTRLDKAEVSGKSELTIFFTITGFSSQEIDKTKWETEFVPSVKKNANKTVYGILLKRGFDLRIRYTANDGVVFSEILLTLKDLNTAPP